MMICQRSANVKKRKQDGTRDGMIEGGNGGEKDLSGMQNQKCV